MGPESLTRQASPDDSAAGSPAASDRLETGIEILDRKLHGGLPAGGLVAVSAAPASQSERFLLELAAARPTLYLSTARPGADVRARLDGLSVDEATVVVAEADPADRVGHALDLVGTLPTASTFVVDPLDPFESLSAARYWSFLGDLRAGLSRAGAVGILHCLDGRAVSPLRDATEYVADVVLRLETARRGERVETTLTVPKYRGGRPLEDVIKLDLSTSFDVDLSRNIV